MPSSTEQRSLPAISVVDRADDHLGRLLSDVDAMTSAVESFVGDGMPLHDFLFLRQSGIAIEDSPRHPDPATLARLLVFANELADDAKAIEDYAQRLRAALLTTYRECIIDRRLQREATDA
jgi:hypothetical protein